MPKGTREYLLAGVNSASSENKTSGLPPVQNTDIKAKLERVTDHRADLACCDVLTTAAGHSQQRQHSVTDRKQA